MAPPTASPGFSAVAHGVRLFPGIPRRRCLGEYAPSSRDDAAWERRARSEPDGSHHWQPKREDDGKGGPRGYDAAKKVRGRKRQIAVDTQGLLLGVVVHAADIQDAEGAWDLLKRLKPLYCWLRVVFADSSYDRLAVLIACFLLGLTLIVVRRIAGITGFMVLPRRWVVERRSVGSDDGGGCRRIMRSCPRFLRRWSPWLWSASWFTALSTQTESACPARCHWRQDALSRAATGNSMDLCSCSPHWTPRILAPSPRSSSQPDAGAAENASCAPHSIGWLML